MTQARRAAPQAKRGAKKDKRAQSKTRRAQSKTRRQKTGAAKSVSSASLMTTTALTSAVIETPPAPETISWEDAVAEGKQLIATADRTNWRLAELADQVAKDYGENTLAKFAREIGMSSSSCAIERRRSTYRNWKDILKRTPGLILTYSVARVLEKHPDRERLIKENPRMTKGHATTLMKAYRGSDTKSETERRWEDLIRRAGKAMDDETFFKVDREILLAVVKQKTLSYLREGLQAGIRLVDEFEKLFNEPANDTSFDDAAA